MKRDAALLLPLPFALAALLAGLWAGLVRLGWPLPALSGSVTSLHGALMVSGFLGTLIILERVVALRQRWMLAAPLLTSLGWVSGLAFPKTSLGPALIALGSLGGVIILSSMVYREPALHIAAMGLGAWCWLTGNLLWLAGRPIYQIVFWWMGFLVLTIAGERLELSRVLRLDRTARGLFVFLTGLFLAGLVWTARDLALGERIAGAGLLGFSAWLVRFDLARRNLRHPAALTRYIARCLFAGYLWLGASGLLALWMGGATAGPSYDAMLHSLFIGFVLSMIFGHAPIILPAFLGRMMPYRSSFSISLALLHASLLARIAGDLAGWAPLRQWGGLFNEISLLLFLVFLVTAIRNVQAGLQPSAAQRGA